MVGKPSFTCKLSPIRLFRRQSCRDVSLHVAAACIRPGAKPLSNTTCPAQRLHLKRGACEPAHRWKTMEYIVWVDDGVWVQLPGWSCAVLLAPTLNPGRPTHSQPWEAHLNACINPVTNCTVQSLFGSEAGSDMGSPHCMQAQQHSCKCLSAVARPALPFSRAGRRCIRAAAETETEQKAASGPLAPSKMDALFASGSGKITGALNFKRDTESFKDVFNFAGELPEVSHIVHSVRQVVRPVHVTWHGQKDR